MQQRAGTRMVDGSSLVRCLIGYGASPADGWRIAAAVPDSLADAFEAAMVAGRVGTTVSVQLAVNHAEPALDALLDRLDRLDRAQRRALLAHHIGGVREAALRSEADAEVRTSGRQSRSSSWVAVVRPTFCSR